MLGYREMSLGILFNPEGILWQERPATSAGLLLKKKNTSTSVSSSSPFSNSPPLSSLPPSSPRHQQGRRQRRQAPATCHRRPPPPVSPLPFLSLSPALPMRWRALLPARVVRPRLRDGTSITPSSTLVAIIYLALCTVLVNA